jgi:hypothetical protein
MIGLQPGRKHGGSTTLHLRDPEYVVIEDLIFEQQTANGIDIGARRDNTTTA